MSKRYVDVVCFDAQLDNGGGGNPFVLLSLRVVNGEEAGKNITTRAYLTEKGRPITYKHMRALGWTGTKLSKAMSEGLGSLTARALLIVNEKGYDDVKGIYPIADEGSKPKTNSPVDSESLAAFDALFADEAAAFDTVPVTDKNRAPATLPPSKRFSSPAAKSAEPDPF